MKTSEKIVTGFVIGGLALAAACFLRQKNPVNPRVAETNSHNAVSQSFGYNPSSPNQVPGFIANSPVFPTLAYNQSISLEDESSKLNVLSNANKSLINTVNELSNRVYVLTDSLDHKSLQVSNANYQNLSLSQQVTVLRNTRLSLPDSQEVGALNLAMTALNLPNMQNYIVGEFDPKSRSLTNLTSLAYNGGKSSFTSAGELGEFAKQVSSALSGMPAYTTSFENLMIDNGASMAQVRTLEGNDNYQTVFDDLAYFSRNARGSQGLIVYTNRATGNIMVGADNLSEKNLETMLKGAKN